MLTRIGSFIASLMIFMGVAADQAAANGWLRDVEHGLRVAKAQQRPMVLFISSDGCVYCDKMIATTFSDLQVRRTLGTRFVATAIKSTERPDLMRKLKVRSFPTTVLVTPKGEVIEQIVGYVEPEKFNKLLATVTRQESTAAVNAPTRQQTTRAMPPVPTYPVAAPISGTTGNSSRR